MDIGDRASVVETRQRNAALKRFRESKSKAKARSNCISCGEIITEKRRKAVPNVQRCVDCQKGVEG